MAPISQREARRLMKQVAELQRQIKNQRARWSQDYFGGVEIGRAQWEPNGAIPTAIRTARKLDHAVVAVGDDSGGVRFVALPHPSESV